MIQLSAKVTADYWRFLVRHGIGEQESAGYLKWLRYFLDYCTKYQLDGSESERIRKFLSKLREKKQTDDQRRVALHVA